MKREILFRGKRADNGELVISDSLMQVKGQNPRLWVEFDGWVEVIPETVGQFTGLTDKNGKKIFEGDILKGCWKMIFEVYYDDCLLQFRAKTVDGFNKDIDYYGYPHQIEVIGNIYNNPELLEGKQHEQRTVRRI